MAKTTKTAFTENRRVIADMRAVIKLEHIETANRTNSCREIKPCQTSRAAIEAHLRCRIREQEMPGCNMTRIVKRTVLESTK